MLEYIPGEYAHRPVEARGYMFIHCIWVGFRKEFKGKGHGSSLIDECIIDARSKGMLGVAVVTRDGPFKAKGDIFLKKDFHIVDRAAPDFQLLALKFDAGSESPRFKSDMDERLTDHGGGLVILRSPQCPYSEKNVNEIIRSAKGGIRPGGEPDRAERLRDGPKGPPAPSAPSA